MAELDDLSVAYEQLLFRFQDLQNVYGDVLSRLEECRGQVSAAAAFVSAYDRYLADRPHDWADVARARRALPERF